MLMSTAYTCVTSRFGASGDSLSQEFDALREVIFISGIVLAVLRLEKKIAYHPVDTDGEQVLDAIGKNWTFHSTCHQLKCHASQTPDIRTRVVALTQDDLEAGEGSMSHHQCAPYHGHPCASYLRAAILSGLDVFREVTMPPAGIAQINDSHPHPPKLLEKVVPRLALLRLPACLRQGCLRHLFGVFRRGRFAVQAGTKSKPVRPGKGRIPSLRKHGAKTIGSVWQEIKGAS
eukprot:scaffold756_cov281-Pinguiococcus_pyrenoidosus.AAC.6